MRAFLSGACVSAVAATERTDGGVFGLLNNFEAIVATRGEVFSFLAIEKFLSWQMRLIPARLRCDSYLLVPCLEGEAKKLLRRPQFSVY